METINKTATDVIDLIGTTLGIEDRVSEFGPETALLGELPELDSQGIVLLLISIEERFGFQIDDADFTGAIFETVGSLTDFVAERRAEGK